MNLKNILFASFALSGIAAAGESFDENDLNARAPVCYCCSGFIVRNIAGTRCGSAGGSCDSSDILCCANGGVVWPPISSQNSSSVVCKG
jgi:hypothetical protein